MKHNLTPEKLIKAITACNNRKGDRCSQCPMFSKYKFGQCRLNVDRQAVKLIKELQQENAELKARLEKSVEFPCQIGDVVYARKLYFYLPHAIRTLSTDIIDCKVVAVKKTSKGILILLKPLTEEAINKRSAYKWFSLNSFNKIAFKNKEEAEQALKERELNG